MYWARPSIDAASSTPVMAALSSSNTVTAAGSRPLRTGGAREARQREREKGSKREKGQERERGGRERLNGKEHKLRER